MCLVGCISESDESCETVWSPHERMHLILLVRVDIWVPPNAMHVASLHEHRGPIWAYPWGYDDWWGYIFAFAHTYSQTFTSLSLYRSIGVNNPHALRQMKHILPPQAYMLLYETTNWANLDILVWRGGWGSQPSGASGLVLAIIDDWPVRLGARFDDVFTEAGSVLESLVTVGQQRLRQAREKWDWECV